MRLVCGYKVDGFDSTQRDNLVIFTIIVYYVNGTYRQEYSERLVDFVVQVRFTQFFNEDGVSTAQQVIVFFFYFIQNTNVKVWFRERVTVQYVVRQVQFQINFTYFVFEQFFQRFNQVYFYFFRQVVYVVVRFDDVCFIGCRRRRFDNVRVDGVLRQLFYVFQFQRFFIEYFNENAIDDFTFCFRIVFVSQR